MYERKITLPLTESEWRALCDNARMVDRTPKLQARHLIKSALGLAAATNEPNKHNCAVPAYQGTDGAIVAAQ